MMQRGRVAPRITKVLVFTEGREGRLAWAKIARHRLGDQISDGDVFAGMYAVVIWLGTVSTESIQ